MRRKYNYFWRRIEKKFIGLMLLAIGIAIIAIIILPPSAWIILAALALIFIGYKLFCGY
ncbi:hypothetical protein [Crassaminicella thermophila]|uniref:hypothetical protein n=1 Tax=Crassaminicella thermophila TaxID=2599308 RepID=UPI00143D5264|nr:hypothetical protein [Crassaminicella thermophila]